jgi:hypothetical protein
VTTPKGFSTCEEDGESAVCNQARTETASGNGGTI